MPNTETAAPLARGEEVLPTAIPPSKLHDLLTGLQAVRDLPSAAQHARFEVRLG